MKPNRHKQIVMCILAIIFLIIVTQIVYGIDFTSPTPPDGSNIVATAISVNLTTNDSSEHYSFVDFDNSLVLWMRMDDGNSTTMFDLVRGSNGTLINGAFRNLTGRYNASAGFDGVNDYINLTNSALDPAFNISGAVTISAWAKTLNGSGNPEIAGKYTYLNNRRSYILYIANNNFTFTAQSNASLFNTSLVVTSNISSIDGLWHHVVGIFNPGVSLSIYVDGILRGNMPTSNTFMATNTMPFIIGADASSANPWNGSIDDVLLFNRSLSYAEVLSLYNASATKYYNNFTNLALGIHTVKGYSNDVYGNMNQTETRTITLAAAASDTTPPQINFTTPTPATGSYIGMTAIDVNVSTNDSSEHYSFVDFDNSLVLWMRMDDGNSSTMFDLTGKNNGSMINGAFRNLSGKYNASASFDGVDDYIGLGKSQLGSTRLFANSTDLFTVSFWAFNIDNGTFISRTNSTAQSRIFQIFYQNPLARPGLYLRGNALNLDYGLSLNKWYHYVVTWNGTSGNLYINGTFITNLTAGTAVDTNFDILIGARRNTDNSDLGFLLNGSMDEVLIFNRSLSAAEISSLYNASATQYYNNFTSLGTGAHTIKAYAVDVYGNMNQTETRTITLLSTPTIIYPVYLNKYTESWFGEVNISANLTSLSNPDYWNVTALIYSPQGYIDSINLSNKSTGYYSGIFKIDINNSARNDIGSWAVNITMSNSTTTLSNNTANFSVIRVYRSTVLTSLNVSQNSNTDYRHTLRNYIINSSGAYNNIIVKIPIINHPNITELSVSSPNLNYYETRNNTIVVNVNTTSSFIYLNISFNATTDTIVTYLDSYTTPHIMYRDGFNGYMFWNSQQANFILAKGGLDNGKIFDLHYNKDGNYWSTYCAERAAIVTDGLNWSKGNKNTYYGSIGWNGSEEWLSEYNTTYVKFHFTNGNSTEYPFTVCIPRAKLVKLL